MHVPFTQKILKDWAGPATFQKGMTLFEKGKVDNVEYDHPFVTGQLAIGIRGMRSKFEVLKDGFVENHCPCRDNREEGKICAHLVALGLEAIRLYSDPHRVDKMAEEKRRAERLASFDDSEYHTRDPNGTPAELRIILKQSWRENLAEQNVPMRCAVEIDGKVIPLNEVPKKKPIALSEADDNLLFVIEDICEGPAKAKFEATLADFINILELCDGKPIYEGGIDGYLMTADGTVATSLQMTLDEITGELVLRIFTTEDTEEHRGTSSETSSEAGGKKNTFIVSGGSGWVLKDGIFQRLEKVLPGPMRAIYDGEVRIPREAIPGFMKNERPALGNMIEIESNVTPDMLSLSPAKPRFRLVVDGQKHTLSATLYAEYNGVRLVAGKEDAKGHFSVPASDDLLGFQVRNPEAEEKALETITELGFRGRRGDMLMQIRGNREVLNFLGGALPRLKRKGWRIDLEGEIAAFMDDIESTVPVVHINNSASNGFFEVGYDFETDGGVSLDETEIQRAINMGEAFVEKKGRTVLLDINAIETARDVFSDCAVGAGEKPGTFKMNDIHAAYVQSSLLSLDGIDIESAPEWMSKADAQNRDAKVEPVDLGPKLEKTLRDYQKDGVYWLRFLERSNFAGILADEMGLGKTLQTLTWLSLERENDQATDAPALIICPTSLVDNWAEEAEKFVPHLRVQKMHGPDRHDFFPTLGNQDLIITSYALIRRDLDEYLKHTFSVVVLDEAQHIKNRTTQNATAVKKVAAHHKLVLSGTPIENSVTDLWSIMDFLMPGYLGNHKAFRENYELPIQNGGPDAELAQIRLRRKLHPFLLRRLKKDVAKDLPDKIQRVAHCTLSGDQAKVYKQLAESAKKEITGLVDQQGFNKSRMQILKILLQLRQTCCHLDLLKLPGLSSEFPSAKMELFFELVNEALDAGHRILVFSQFTSMLSIIREELEARALKYCYLDGTTKDRQERVKRFNSDRSIPLFLISLKAGGSGLNLTGADMVIHFDPWWNPAVEDQATDRAHRIGQKNTVYSIKLITKGTVEEKVLQMQQKKKSIIDATLEKDADMAQSLTWNDVQELLSV
ncbi:SNF2-related protein [Pontiella agarivorans]|uniref:SNF2-related protein n=1 Tax=Pontiella agarivorans TaxID=3038953 RepID=A0ABU5MYR8_9BACT|nr:SNF2-related protein [Pontiella agarivorans]MDZ8119332.1 SNF2-related protein [Pontiella agarivorans]